MSSRTQQGGLWSQQQAMERGRRIAIPLKVDPLPPGTFRIILPANGQAAIHDAVEEAQVCGTRGCGDVAVGVDKGCTEVHLDRDGERHKARLGNRLSAESDHRKVQGRRRNRLRVVVENHAAKGRHRKPTPSGRTIWATGSGNGGSPCTTEQVRDHLRQAAHSTVDKAGTIACEDLSAPMQSAPYRPPSPERMGQERHGRNPHFDISAQRFCTGLGQSGLQLANRLPDGPVAGHVSRRPVFCPKRIVPDADISTACNNLVQLDDDGKTLHIPVGHVRALLAERTWTAAGTCFPPGRVAGTCNSTPVNRERSTRVGPEVCRVKKPDCPLLGCDQDARLIYSRAEPFGPIPFHLPL